jgi:quinol monooxygenase YgiN
MIALLVVALGAVVAAVGTGVLVARSTSKPRIYSVAWSLALFGLAIGLAAATLGFLAGYGSLLFRAMELGTQLIAPLSLVIAMVETVGKSLAARFAMRLAIAGISVIALVILGTDPINPDVTFGKTWPDPAKFYQLAPLTVLGLIALLTAIAAVSTLGVLMLRSRRDGLPRAETRPVQFTALAALLVVLPGLIWLANKGLGISLPIPVQDVFALCSTVAAGLLWYAARMAGNRDLSQAGAGSASGRNDRDQRTDDDWDDRAGYGQSERSSSHGRYETGAFDQYGQARPDDYDARRVSHAAGYNEDELYGAPRSTPLYDEPVSDARYPGLAALAVEPTAGADDAVRFSEPAEFIHTGAIDTRGARYDNSGQYDADHRNGPGVEDSGVFYADDTGYGFSRVEADDGQAPGWDDPADQRGGKPRGELFGQITIYTLIEGRTDDFDRLTEWVMAQVQSKEPDTLVYIVHAVPTAPMQRILYEVYRDRDAHEEHLNRQYVITYEVEQRPFVLATNVIELGVQQAKVSPLPSMSALSDMLSESGVDLTGVTRSPASSTGAVVLAPSYQRAPVADPQYDDPRHGDRRYPEPQYPQPQYPGQQEPTIRRSPDPQYPDPPYPDPQYPDPQYPDPQYPEPQFRDPRYVDQRHVDPRYADQQHVDPRYEDPHQGGWAEIGGEDSRY